MLPMAAIIALLLSGHHLRLMLIPVAILVAVLAVVRIASRKARARAFERVPSNPAKAWGYQGRRRAQ
jgi:hypothetical protein